MDFEQIQQAIETLSDQQQRALAKWLRAQAAARARARRAREKREAAGREFFRTRALLWTIASLAAFLLIESAIFRLGWYNKYLEPDSSAGMVEDYLYWLKRSPHIGLPEVMLIGNSRVAEGFSQRDAGRLVENRIRFWNAGIGGTTPRVWYYFLRDADPTRRRFAAILIALDQYSDEDTWTSMSDWPIDLSFVIARLRPMDCLDFVRSMASRAVRDKTLSGCLLRGITLRRDAQAFLVNIPDRIKRSKDALVNGLAYLDGYAGMDEDLRGLSADFVRRTIQFPPGLDLARRNNISATVMPPAPPRTGEMSRYRELWLGRILDLYQGSPTHIVFVEMPRAPLPKPDSPQPALFLHHALARPRVSALPPGAFRDLERPEFFFDGYHLNKAGRAIFSRRIAETVPPLIGAR
jgi:hypothetical protein